MSFPFIVAGVDVGSPKKGFHAVALRDGKYAGKCADVEIDKIIAWCRRIGAVAIGVDAPSRWNNKKGFRPAEEELIKDGTRCFPTPIREKALGHRTDNYGWILNGERLFEELVKSHPLFDNPPSFPCCFETYPYAVTRALDPTIRWAKTKDQDRRKLLVNFFGGDTKELRPLDLVDAALCALAAHFVKLGQYKSFGESETGFIVVPSNPNTQAETRA